MVKYLINSLEDNGFLIRDLYSISSDLLTNNDLVVSEKDLITSLKILQQLDPLGIGAKNLQDCLLIQLKNLHPTKTSAFQIISEFYTPFSNKNFEHLIKNVPISEKNLKDVYRLVESLNPFPAAGFSKNSSPVKYIYADFSIIESNGELQLQINKGNTKNLKVSKYYSNLLIETTDEKTKEPLPFCKVLLIQNGSTKAGANTDFDGKFQINAVAAGTYDVEIRNSDGYQPTQMKGVIVSSEKITFLDVSGYVTLEE